MPDDSHPYADLGREFWVRLRAALPGRGLDGGSLTDDPFYFRFPGPANIVPGMVGVVPALRFSPKHSMRPQSEMRFTNVAPDTRERLVANRPRLQAAYQGSDEVMVRKSGATLATVEVIHTGSLFEPADWPEYIEWFITTQLALRHALQEVYGQPESASEGALTDATLDSPLNSVEDEQIPAPDTDTAIEDELEELGYASPEETRAVDDVAMKLAIEKAKGRWAEAEVRRMPHNNPGYDIEVVDPLTGVRYIEVKGTRSADPAFFITLRELMHARDHPDRYSIWIFHGIDLNLGTAASFTEHHGPVDETHFELRPIQYVGRFTGPR